MYSLGLRDSTLLQVTGNLTLSKNEKERTFPGSHSSEVQFPSGFWLAYSKDTNCPWSQYLSLSGLLSFIC